MKKLVLAGIVALALAGCSILPIQVGNPAEDSIVQEYECPTAEFKVYDNLGNLVE
jgi:starvation-inducible outer membrane lipoprotein